MIDPHPHKEALTAEAKVLQESLRELGVPHQGVPYDYDETPGAAATTEPDPNVAADRNEEWHTRRAEVATLEVRLQNVMRALQKIEAHTFGNCEVCNQAIEAARLDANPAARTCIAHRDTTPASPTN